MFRDKQFHEMSSSEKYSIVRQIGAVLNNNGLGEVPICQTREMVFNANDMTFNDNLTVKIFKQLQVKDKALSIRVH